MVPLGSLAFMPGQLVHTNETTVLLGDNYFVERSAEQAVGILERRVKVVEDLISKKEKLVNDLSARGDLSEQASKAIMAELKAEPAPPPPEDMDVENDDGGEDDEEDSNLGQDDEFWSNYGFHGGFASASDTDDDGHDEIDVASGHPEEADKDTFNDDEEVVEILEPLDGGDSKLIRHASQAAFEKGGSFPY